jgi:TetR/AcrR family transcriptional regulator, repressor for neighboring sulfatase
MARLSRPSRRRRSPEVARQELLDAAERVFAKGHPEQVGLKEVARAAGTSHGLITHYFGTYDGLVAAVLERRTTALRERVFVALQDPLVLSRPEELVDMLFAAFQDPVHLRLMKYVVAGDRPGIPFGFALQHKGIAQVADRVAETLHPGASSEMREEVALSLVIAVAAAFGYNATRASLAASIGTVPSRELDRKIRTTLAQMIRVYIIRA